MVEHLETRKSVQERYGLLDTPFVVLYGPFDDLSCIVRIHNKDYEVFDGKEMDVVQAVDICFKAFYALRIDFTLASDGTWIFLESQVYKLKTTIKRKSYKNIHLLLTEFSKL